MKNNNQPNQSKQTHFQINLPIFILLIITTFSSTPLNYSPSTTPIFFIIPNYRDIRCSATIHNIYQKSSNPNRIYISLVQEIFTQDDDPIKLLSKNIFTSEKEKKWLKTNLLILTKPAEREEGLHMNTHQSQAMLLSKDLDGFILKVDAHSDFILNYDTALIEKFNNISDENAVIATFPLPTEYISSQGLLSDEQINYGKSCSLRQHSDGIICLLVAMISTTNEYPCFASKGYCKGFFIAGGFQFSRLHMAKNIPYDPYLNGLFNGEQFLYSARIFTWGYNIYISADNYIFHLYGKGWFERAKSQIGKKGHPEVYLKTLNRYKRLLGIGNVEDGESELGEIRKYGMGDVRSLKEFYEEIGIDPNKSFEGLNDKEVMSACEKLDADNK